MEYIFVFVLTISYCQAPDGKTVCEQDTLRYNFTQATHCIEVRNNLVYFLDTYDNVIVYREKSKCHVEAEPVVTTPDADTDWATKNAEQELEIALRISPYEGAGTSPNHLFIKGKITG